MRLEEVFEPEWSYLLVRRDPVSRVVGVGLNGQGIIAPESSWDVGRPHTGEVVKCGPDAPWIYAVTTWDEARGRKVGVRVVFQLHSGHEMRMSGEDMVLLPVTEVLAIGRDWSGAIEDEDAAEHLEPPPGHLLVERAEAPVERGRITIPDGVSTATRSHEAEILASAVTQSRRFEVGETVFLGPSVRKGFAVGLRADRKILRCTEPEILGHVKGEMAPVELQPDNAAHLRALQGERPFDERFNEGDLRAPQ